MLGENTEKLITLTVPIKKDVKRIGKNGRKNHHLYAQNDTLLLADVFESFRNMCLQLYEIYPTCSLCTASSHTMKTKVKIDLLTNIDMLLIIRKVI